LVLVEILFKAKGVDEKISDLKHLRTQSLGTGLSFGGSMRDWATAPNIGAGIEGIA
jgi:hypothetical protein